MQHRTVIKIVKRSTRWILLPNVVDKVFKLKSKAVDAAFRYAKRHSPTTVKIYSANGRMQVMSDW